jgi:KDO2-lipid IV(A) lauroyltransferase
MSVQREQVASKSSVQWPVPWEAVEGNQTGFLAQCEALVVRGALTGLASLSWSLKRGMARALARLGPTLDPGHARDARSFLEAAYGPDLPAARREELVAAGYENLLWLILEGLSFERSIPEERRLEQFDFQTTPDFERLRAGGTGALLLTAHVGNWEYLPLVLMNAGLKPFYAVSRPPRNQPLSRYAQELRERRGYRLLHRHGAAASIPKVIAAGGFVGLMVDQRARRKTIVAPFFGRPAHCERAVAVFARRLGVPVLFAACYRTSERWRYQVEIPRIFWPEELAHLSPEEITVRINRELERMILAHPEQYFWLHDRYRDAPASERKD